MSKDAKFQQELITEGERSLKLAKKNYYLASVLIIASIISSFLTAIAIASGDTLFSNLQLALLAAIPVTVLTFNSKLKYEEKSKWYYSRFHKINSLRREYEFNGLSLAAATQALNRIIDDAEKVYPGFGGDNEDN